MTSSPMNVGVLADLDLHLVTLDTGEATGRLQVADGAVDAGLLATIADILGGSVAIRAAWPCGISTTDMTVLAGAQRHPGGELVARGSLVSASKTRAVTKVVVTTPGDPAIESVIIATFRIWAADGSVDFPAQAGSLGGDAVAVLDESLAVRAGVAVDAAQHSASVELTPAVANHIGALQGGVSASLLEAAAATCVGGNEHLSSMALTYIAQGRTGPVVARAERVTTGVVEVEAFDTGNGDRPVAHAIFEVR